MTDDVGSDRNSDGILNLQAKGDFGLQMNYALIRLSSFPKWLDSVHSPFLLSLTFDAILSTSNV